MAIENKMRIHGENMEDITITEKILRSMTSKFNYVVCSIEESNDTTELSIDECRVHYWLMRRKWIDKVARNKIFKSHLTITLQKVLVAEEEEGEETILVVGATRTRNLKKNLQILKEGEEAWTTTIIQVIISWSQLTSRRLNDTDVTGMTIINQKLRTSLNGDGGWQSNFAEKEEEISLLMAYQEKEQATKEIHQNIW